MKRRTLLVGGTAALGVGAVGCSFGPHYDASNAEVSHPPIGKFVTADGIRLHYWEAGEGQPVILVHGASGNIRDWTFSIAPELAKSYRVIAIDRPGFGFSDRQADQGWDPAVQARALRGAAIALGAEQPIVVGHSWGGALAMAWALHYPGETRGVVPISGVTQPYGGLARVFRALGLDGVIVNAYTSYVRRTAADGGIDRFVERAFKPLQPPDGYVDYVGAPLSLREATVRANAEDIQNLNTALVRMKPQYASLRLPVEIIHGADDFIDADRHAIPLAEDIAQANLTLLPGVGHMAHHADLEAIKAALDRIVA